MTKTFADFSSSNAFVISKLQLVERDLNDAITALRFGRTSRSLFRAVNLTLPCEPFCEFAHKDLLRFDFNNQTNLIITTLAHVSPFDSEIVKAFELVKANKTHMCTLTYIGEEKVAFDSSNLKQKVGSSCRMSFISHKSNNLYTITGYSCSTERQGWKLQKCLPKENHPGPKIQIKRVNRNFYI